MKKKIAKTGKKKLPKRGHKPRRRYHKNPSFNVPLIVENRGSFYVGLQEHVADIVVDRLIRVVFDPLGFRKMIKDVLLKGKLEIDYENQTTAASNPAPTAHGTQSVEVETGV